MIELCPCGCGYPVRRENDQIKLETSRRKTRLNIPSPAR